MRAILVEQLGDPTLALGAGVMKLVHDHPTRPVGSQEVLISVLASSLNFPDALQVKVRHSRAWARGHSQRHGT